MRPRVCEVYMHSFFSSHYCLDSPKKSELLWLIQFGGLIQVIGLLQVFGLIRVIGFIQVVGLIQVIGAILSSWVNLQ